MHTTGARQDTLIAYHGTSTVALPSILRDGLVPNPERRVWAADASTAFDRFSRASLPGIYVTRNLLTALGAARTATQKLGGGEPCVVILQMNRLMGVADEDTVTFTLANLFSSTLREAGFIGFYGFSPDKALAAIMADPALEERLASRFVERAHEQFMDAEGRPPQPPRDALTQLFGAFLRRSFALRPIASWGSDWYLATEGYFEAAPPEPTFEVAELDATISSALEAITRRYKALTHSDRNSFMQTFRLTEPVGLRGRNRILGVVQAGEKRHDATGPLRMRRKGWGARGQIILLWGAIPSEFFTDWAARMNPTFEVTTRTTQDRRTLGSRRPFDMSFFLDEGGGYGELEDVEAPLRSNVVKRPRVIWFNDSDLPTVAIPAEYVFPEPNNIMDGEKLAAFTEAMQAAGVGERTPPTFRMPLGSVSRVDIDDVESSQRANAEGHLHELGLDQPFTTGDEEVDDYLADPDTFVENDDTPETLHAEMQERVQEQVDARDGDLGRVMVRLEDGHHRAFAAILAGEPVIYVRASQYSSI